MNVSIRKEKLTDFKAVNALIKKAFENDPHSEHNEHLIVKRLRLTKTFIPDFSIVAEYEGKPVGYILLTQIIIKGKKKKTTSLALAPVAVSPEFQNKGIGTQLINYAHSKAKEQGFESIVVIGHENYYPKFGYLKASSFGINFPFEAPDENCMAIELTPDSLKSAAGLVEYPKAFLG
ncbi:GNAT family N-acetyltransferase [Mangrovimonas aestuarii]|uniref:GNAT family N-acetyltransferase n=1 Tax=Mangrovimonas aestuarii TaxID=3018443 RepID=UPI002377D5EC|nr:N-acetyltransferase [Mangrovimonas aestuarii]